MKVAFYNRTTSQDSAVPIIYVKCLNCLTNDYLIDSASSDTSILLPLSAVKDTSFSAFYIETDSIYHYNVTVEAPDSGYLVPHIKLVHVRRDTLIVYYKRKNAFISYECGFLPEFTINSYLLKGKLPSDTVVISQNQVNTNNETNIKIYFTPVTHR
jgi:hypothetical protein